MNSRYEAINRAFNIANIRESNLSNTASVASFTTMIRWYRRMRPNEVWSSMDTIMVSAMEDHMLITSSLVESVVPHMGHYLSQVGEI